MSDRGGTANRNAGRTGLRPGWRLLLVWLVAAATLLLVAALLPGVDVGGLGPALAAAALLGLLNGLVWPLLVRLALPLTVLTLVSVCAIGACGGGMSAADGLKKAEDVRASTAAMYWKVRDPLPATLDRPSGQGAFSKCSKTSDAVT